MARTKDNGQLLGALMNHKTHIRALEAVKGNRKPGWNPDNKPALVTAMVMSHKTVSPSIIGPPTGWLYTITEIDTGHQWTDVQPFPLYRQPGIAYAPFVSESAVSFYGSWADTQIIPVMYRQMVLFSPSLGFIMTGEHRLLDLFPVVLEQTGGTAGDASNYCSFTYTVKTLKASSPGTLGETKAPLNSRARIVKGPCTAATKGTAYYDLSFDLAEYLKALDPTVTAVKDSLVLWDCDELHSTGSCA